MLTLGTHLAKSLAGRSCLCLTGSSFARRSLAPAFQRRGECLVESLGLVQGVHRIGLACPSCA
jgi:hypothetical protein